MIDPNVVAPPVVRFPVVSVTAVVVTNGLTGYVERTLTALSAQTRSPDHVIVVDVAVTRSGRPDAGLVDLLARFWSAESHTVVSTAVIAAPSARTFGDAVRRALATPGVESPVEATARHDPPGWLWLLHDDSAPEPEALAELLRVVELAPSVAVAGCKQRTWDDPVRVLELGVTTSRFGRRMTGLDEPEVDQGQHDAREDVFAVGLAGALVRRDVWDNLGGPDPALGPYSDGLDLCRRARLSGHRVVVVPAAVVRHAQASMRGSRPQWDARRSLYARREALVHTQLVGAPAAAVPAVAVLAVAGAVVRAVGRLAAKEPSLATAELAAPLRVIGRPRAVAQARSRDHRTRVVSRRTLRPLHATWREVTGQMRDRRMAAAELRRTRTAPSELELSELAALSRRRRFTLTAALVVVAAITAVVMGSLISQVAGGARVVGDDLAFGDAHLSDLWAAATSWWSGGGYGEPAPPEPLLSVLVPLTAVVGSVGAATVVILVGALVLAAVGAWFAAGAATRSVALRAWAVLVWVSAPALLVSVDQARLGAVLAHVVLPWFVLGITRGVGVARTDTVESGLVGAARLTRRSGSDADVASKAGAHLRSKVDAGQDGEAPGDADGVDAVRVVARVRAVEPSIAAGAGAALAFVVLTAAEPIMLVAGIVLLAIMGLAVRLWGRLLWICVPALVLHGPVLVQAARSWGDGGWRLLVAEPGVPNATEAASAWEMLLGRPVMSSAGTTGLTPEVITRVLPLVAAGVLLLVAAAALVRRTGRRAVVVAWVAVAVGIGAALTCTRVVCGVADTADGALLATGSAAPGISLALAGVLAAVLVGAAGVRTALGSSAFGWRQTGAALIAMLVVVGPGLTLGVWAWENRGGTGHLATTGEPVVPALGQQMQQTSGVRVLMIEPFGDGVAATVFRQNGPQLTDMSRVVELRDVVDGPDQVDAQIADIAARLSVGGTSDISADLDALGIGAVLVPPGEDEGRAVLSGRLDATPGLERVTATGAGVIWRSTGVAAGTAGWARVLDSATSGDADVLDVLPAPVDGRIEVDLPAGEGQRLIVLAERSDLGWRARVDGEGLRAVDVDWRQAFEVGPQGGHLVVEFSPPTRTPWLVVQGLVFAVTVLLALPIRRRRGGTR